MPLVRLSQKKTREIWSRFNCNSWLHWELNKLQLSVFWPLFLINHSTPQQVDASTENPNRKADSFGKEICRSHSSKVSLKPKKKNNGVIPKQVCYIPFDNESHLDTKRGGIKTYQCMHIRKINSIKNEATETLAQHFTTVCSVVLEPVSTSPCFSFEDAIGRSVLILINPLFEPFTTDMPKEYTCQNYTEPTTRKST